MKINWLNSKKPKTLYFSDLKLNQNFRNAGAYGKGAVYTKIVHHDQFGSGDTGGLFMLEIATGKFFPPTKAPVELVDVEINIATEKPDIYE